MYCVCNDATVASAAAEGNSHLLHLYNDTMVTGSFIAFLLMFHYWIVSRWDLFVVTNSSFHISYLDLFYCL